MSNTYQSTPKKRRPVAVATTSLDSREHLLTQLSNRIIGQPAALETIIPRVQLFRAGLNPEGRPAGAFMLLGPTGVGKTHTVEALAEVIHGSRKNVLRIDCGEFQMEHEVAKLIGAPPGYLGHRETQPVLTQVKLNQVMSERANLAIILFDEIEKAAPSLLRILLGVLDKGSLRLGDNTTVQFERTLIFFTSNLGSEEIARETSGGLGFSKAAGTKDLSRVTSAALKNRLPTEFMNRIDAFVTYSPLGEKEVTQILDIELQNLADHISRRLGDRRIYLQVPTKTRSWLVSKGFSARYGARELKRTVQKHLLEPLAELLIARAIPPGEIVRFDVARSGDSLKLSFDSGDDRTLISERGKLSYIFKTARASTEPVCDREEGN